MAYAVDEVSQRGGKPNELYRFRGTYANYYYTTGPRAVPFQAPDEDEVHIYQPIAMERSAVNSGTQDDDKLDLVVKMAVTHQVVLDYGFQDTPPRLDLTIWRYHTIDSVVPFWTGSVDNITTSKGIASIRTYSALSAALSQDFPNVYYQAPCNNVLYDARCKVLEADYSADVGILAIAGRAITVASVPAVNENLAGDALVGGEMRLSSGERRMVTQIDAIVIPPAVPGDAPTPASVVTVNFPFSQLEVGDDVTVTAGCDLAYTGNCKALFNNQRNFTGFPFIPPENVFQTGVEPGSSLPDNTCLPPRFEGWIWRVGYRIYRNGRTNDDWTPGFSHMGGVATREITDRDGNLWTYLWRDGPNNPAPEPGENGSFLFSFGFGSGNGTTCSQVFPNDPDNRCLAEVFVQHWTMANPVVVGQGPHYSVGPISYQFVFPAIG